MTAAEALRSAIDAAVEAGGSDIAEHIAWLADFMAEHMSAAGFVIVERDQLKETEVSAVDWTKPIERSDGRPARVLSRDLRHHGDHLTVVAIDFGGMEQVNIASEDGTIDKFARIRNVIAAAADGEGR